jgi:outer membrane protein assembly factor BamB
VRIALVTSIILNIVLFGYLLVKRNQLPEAADPMQPVFSMGGQVFAPPAVFGDNLILAAEDGAVRAVNVETGSQKWVFRTGDKVTAAPLVDGNKVYLGSWDQQIYALNAEDGSLIWKAPVGGCIFSAPVLADGVLYVCTREGNVLAIDAESGGQKWRNSTRQHTTFSPAVHEGTVYIASEGKFLALRAADGLRLGDVEAGRLKTSVINFGPNAFFVAFDDSAGRDALAAFPATPDQLTLTRRPVRKGFIEPTPRQ